MFFKNKLLCVNHRSKKSVILKYTISCHMHFKNIYIQKLPRFLHIWTVRNDKGVFKTIGFGSWH